MSSLKLVTVVTVNYLPRARPFLESLSRLTNIQCYVVCLGFKCDVKFTPCFQLVHMPNHWSADNGILQSGRWLDVLPDYSDDDVYLLSDADIVIQRDFTQEERARLLRYDRETFGAGWNAEEGDDMRLEAFRMGMTDSGIFGNAWHDIPCYNTGVLAMRGHAWKRLRDLYESRVRGFWKVNPHRSRCQWLVCYCLHRLGMKADILPTSLHGHGHHGMPKGVSIRNGVAYYRDDVVMFRHAM